MVPMFAKVVVVGRVVKVKEVTPDKKEHFYALLIAVDRPKPVMRPDGEVMDSDFYKVTTNVHCGSLVAGNYVRIEGRLVMKYWTDPKDAPRPTKEYRSDYEVRAETVALVEDDLKKSVVKEPAPVIGRVMSSSLA